MVPIIAKTLQTDTDGPRRCYSLTSERQERLKSGILASLFRTVKAYRGRGDSVLWIDNFFNRGRRISHSPVTFTLRIFRIWGLRSVSCCLGKERYGYVDSWIIKYGSRDNLMPDRRKNLRESGPVSIPLLTPQTHCQQKKKFAMWHESNKCGWNEAVESTKSLKLETVDYF
jgi:hypothetical protein